MQDQKGMPSVPGSETGKDMNPNTRTVNKPQLINKLNYINFQEGTIQVVFEHNKYGHTISLQAKPQPCIGEELECVWPETEIEAYRQLNTYHFKEIQIPNGKNMITVKPEDIFINGKVANFLLPETSYELRARKLRRYSCKNIKAQLIQNSISFQGKLVDFNVSCFRTEIHEHIGQTFSWINSASSLNLILSDSGGILFAGECKISQIRNGFRDRKNYVLEPLSSKINRYKAKTFRATRTTLVPSPYVIFEHPFSKKLKTLSVLDVSGSGLSIKEDRQNGLFVPGMILPEFEIHVGNSFSVKCKAQVIHCSLSGETHNENDGRFIRTGIAFLEMDIQEHGKLLALLHQAKDPNSYLDGRVNEDELWRFFFESGFIYPKKYKFIQENKENIKSTYRKIYTESPKIAKRFIYQDRGEILGHLAMIRFYQKSWMIQHHASLPISAKLAGIDVLDQVGRFINESNNLFSVNMEYVFCYFREDNKFPNHVFGGAARYINDFHKCSLDAFAYFHYQKPLNTASYEIKAPWTLSAARPEDLIEMNLFYKQNSGGIMLNAIELLPESSDIGELVSEYGKFGFSRGRYIFTLRRENSIKAVFVLNLSDIGLNLSDITNSIHVFLLDSKDLQVEILEYALLKLSAYFNNNDVAILLYPRASAEILNIAYEKVYNLWTLDVAFSDDYFNYINKVFKRLNSIKP